MKILAIQAGCAECHSSEDGPLIEAEEFDTMEEAKARFDSERWLGYHTPWKTHPNGGEYIDAGQGSVWLLPVNA